MIPGGYVVFARKIDSSELMHSPPVVRELWFYLIRKVNWKDNGVCKRGEGFFRLEDIQNDLCWYVGYRKMMYSKPQLTKSLRRLRESNAIATAKETRGVRVNVLKYDFYQDKANYEGNDEESAKGERKKSGGLTILEESTNNEEGTTPLTPQGGACPYEEIITHLNGKTGAKYKTDAKETRRLILARWKGGFSLADFKAVIDRKTAEWLTDPKMCEFLRPATLFGAKFESYLNKPSAQNISAPTTTDKCGDCDCFKDCHRKPTADQPACGRFETDPEAQLKRIQARGKY